MKKIKLLLFILIIPQYIFAEDIFLKVIEITPFWENIDFPRESNISGEIINGNIVMANSGIRFSRIENVLENIPLQLVNFNGKEIIVYSRNLIPAETQDLFDTNLLYNPETPIISSFYLNALRSNDREIIYNKDKIFWDAFLLLEAKGSHTPMQWWYYASGRQCFAITQTTLNFYCNVKGRSFLLIKEITKIENGYIIIVKESNFLKGMYFFDWWGWPNQEKQELFTVFLIQDGDYIDLYLNDTNNLKYSFVFVDNEFIIQLNNLIRGEITGNSVDLSKITFWPRRADGSMDYPPPLDMSNYRRTHRATNNLRLRDTANTSAKIVTTLLIDTEVQVIETGASATINDITAPWVKVISNTGFTGWCFSGYLEEIVGSNTVAASVAEGKISVRKSNDNNSLPLPLLLAIIGGAAVAVCVVVAMLRKKK